MVVGVMRRQRRRGGGAILGIVRRCWIAGKIAQCVIVAVVVADATIGTIVCNCG